MPIVCCVGGLNVRLWQKSPNLAHLCCQKTSYGGCKVCCTKKVWRKHITLVILSTVRDYRRENYAMGGLTQVSLAQVSRGSKV